MLKTVVEKYNISGSGFQREIGLFIPAIPKSSRARMRFLGDYRLKISMEWLFV